MSTPRYHRLQQLLQELDYYKFNNHHQDKIEKIEAELETYKNDAQKEIAGKQDKNKKDSNNYIPYPEYTDPEFYDKIYHKKEFNKTSSALQTECAPTNFKLTPNQLFLRNFISPTTPYNGILLFHGVGVGKCFKRGTPILMYDGTTKMVQDIRLYDQVMGDDSTPRRVLTLSPVQTAPLFTVKQNYGMDYTVNADHILTLYDKINKEIIDISVTDYLILPTVMRTNLFGYKNPLTFFPNVYQNCVFDSLAYKFGISQHLTADIKFASPHTRMMFLAGYIDSVGLLHTLNGQKYICFPWDEDVIFVARSVGIGCKKLECGGNIYVTVFGKMLKHIPMKNIIIPDHLLMYSGHLYNITIVEADPDLYYGFSVDKNHRFLLGDFTVTHNSCTAISIAEQFANVFEKKVLVLMPTNLKDNFRKQIFDINKKEQCTGIKYRQMIAHDPLLSKEVVEKRVARIVNDRYQFSGFQEFANGIIRQREAIKNPGRFVSRIKEQFSNRVIIIDEVHNVREDEDSLGKIVTPILLEVIKYAENVKLVLLSATPMFNEASEIVWLINLLLANDKRKLLTINDVFDHNSNLTVAGVAKLQDAVRGYVSHMPGDNPHTFPLRLYPSVNRDPNVQNEHPTLDIKGVAIPAKLQLRHDLELIASPMSELQQKAYNASVAGEHNVTNTQIIQISNIIYPNNTYGALGMKEAFMRKGKQFSYRPNVPRFLSPDLIGQYSPKIKSIVDYIKQSEGIVFVYSFYLDSGIIPLAMALEHEGFGKYNSTNILDNKTKPFILPGTKNQAAYSILTVKKDISSDFNKEIEIAKSPQNADGSIIKVILGTSVAAEGIDFKCIREIHIMEPWYHLNKMEQVIGRAVRHCSHSTLPPEKRNVTIYHHITGSPHPQSQKKRNETVDERFYRIAQNKQVMIDKVEELLKTNAIDCNFRPPVDHVKLTQPLVTSQGTKLRPKMKSSSASASASAPEYKCAHKVKQGPLDESTFHRSFYSEDIDDLAKEVAALFTDHHFYTFDEFVSLLPKANRDILMYTLDHMLTTKYRIVHGPQKMPGYILYRSDMYMFQPNGTSDTYLPIRTRSDYERKKHYLMTIDKQLQKEKDKHQQAAHVNGSGDDQITQLINELTEALKDAGSYVTKQVLYDYVIDRLTPNVLQQVARSALQAPDVPANKHIIKSLEDGHYLLNIDENTIWLRNIFTSEFLSYNPETTRWNKVSLREIQMNKTSKIQVPDFIKLKGYIEPSPTRVPKFKMIDDEKAKSNGYVCMSTSTLKIETLRQLITDSNTKAKANESSDVLDTIKKVNLCDLYELSLRMEKTTFARPYAALLTLKARRAKPVKAPEVS